MRQPGRDPRRGGRLDGRVESPADHNVINVAPADARVVTIRGAPDFSAQQLHETHRHELLRCHIPVGGYDERKVRRESKSVAMPRRRLMFAPTGPTEWTR